MKQILGKSLPELIMMVGPSGAGKSKIAARTGYPVVSTDVIRTNFYGFGPDGKIAAEAYTPDGFRDTFNAAKFIVEGYLMAGQNVVYDATNLARFDRTGFLKYFHLDSGVEDLKIKADVKYYIVDRPLEDKIASYLANIHHNIPVPHTSLDIIERHHAKMAANVDEALLGDKLGFVEVRDFR